MIEQIALTRFKRELFECLDETFERHHGIYLDKNPSLFENLANISASEASTSIFSGRRQIRSNQSLYYAAT